MKSTLITTPDACLLHRKLDLLLRTGSLLMDSSADTARIMRNLNRTMKYLDLDDNHLHMNIDYSILMVNYSDETHSFTKFRRCDTHKIDMTVITAVSHLTWEAIRNNYSLDEYEKKLDEIEHGPRYYTPWQIAVAAGFACGGFCVQFGCDWPAFFYASIAAILGFRLRMFLGAKHMNSYICIGISAFVATILAWLSSYISLSPTLQRVVPAFMHSDTPWHPLMACTLFIVPGVPLINFVSDMLCGHIQTGFVRALNTLLIVIAMAFGIGFAIQIFGINNFVTNLSMTPHHTYVEFAIAAAISAMGFSTIFNTPYKMLPIVAMGGIIAVCTRNFVNLGPSNGNFGLDQGLIMGSLAGSVLVSLIIVFISHRVHIPHQCISIPSVIPMVPGVLMYRALFAFIEMKGVVGEVTNGMHNLMMASMAILVIAIGTSLPNIFKHHLLESKRKIRYYDLLLERRKENQNHVG